MTKLFRFVLVMACLAGVIPASAAFKDIKIDLTGQWLLTTEEFAGDPKPNVEFGIVIADDGTATRVEATDASADAVISGKYHNDHGWGGAKLTLPVDGMVKIGVGNCDYATHTVKVTDAAGNEVAAFATEKTGCWKNNKDDNHVTFGYYRGEATTLTITTSSYTPYLSVEAVAEAPSQATVSYDMGDTEAEGTLPAGMKADVGTDYTLPKNFTLYAEGKTLTAWTDGTDNYAPGQTIKLEKDLKLSPVFTENTVSLADRTDAVMLNFDFQTRNGAPVVGYENVTGIWVTQAVVNGQTIDVKLDFDTNNGGKIANANWTDLAQMNSGTKLTVPSCKGATITLEAYGTITTTTIDGQNDYTQGTTISYTIGGTAETIDIVIGDGSYYRYVKVTLPVASTPGGKTYTDEPVTVAWPMNDTNEPGKYTSTLADAFSIVSFDPGVTSLNPKKPLASITDGNAQEVVKGLNYSAGTGKGDILTWSVKPAQGLTFTPTRLTGYVNRDGTDSENGITVEVKMGDGSTVTLGTWTALRSGKTSSYKPYDATAIYQYDITLTAEQQAVLTGAETFYLTSTVGVGTGKSGIFGEVTVSGTVSGTVANIEKYTLALKANPEEAGTVSVYPKADVYDAGSEVQLTATQNFGYHFTNWADAEGNIISEDAKFTYYIDGNADLTANFQAVKTYELNYNVDGGANPYMVKAYPVPTIVDGKNMYEEGTRVTLTASSNPIMTFTNWSNGETGAEIAIDMNSDYNVTANYDAIDFVAGWDFELKGAEGRKADFYSADNDVAQLILRNEAGETSGWLDKSNEADGGYEGRPGAVNWRTTGLGDYYWQTVLNCEAFTDITVKTAMTYNYNAYQTYNVEYSLDGTNWNKAGQVDMPGRKTWVDAEIALPAECDNQPSLYLRWIADKTSSIDGTTSDNDGACLGATWIIGKAQIVDDGKAPELISTVPAEGSDNASANGKIVLTFNEKVKVAENAAATLGTQTLKPAVSGKTVIFEYKGLEYSTEYTFNLPANTVADLTDNYMAEPVIIGFTTKTRPAVAKALYDFIVPDNGTFNEAIIAANSRTDKSKRFYIFVKNGSYKATNTEGATVVGDDGNTYPSVTTNLTASNVSIIGESMNGTAVYNEPQHIFEGLGKATNLMIQNKVENTYLQDIKLTHTLGDNGRVAVLQDRGNKTICKNVNLDGYQDTYYSNQNGSRFYFETSTLGGRVDFLCGGGDVVFNQCDLVVKGDGTKITAAGTPAKYGYVLLDCTIKGDKKFDGKFTLGRPWSQGASRVQYINTTMELLPTAAGWEEMSGGWPTAFKEYNSHTASGTPVSLTNRKTVFGDGHEADTRTPLTAAEVAELSIANVMGGNDDWDPTAATEQASAPTDVTINGTSLTWKENNYVLCWAVCKDGKVVAFTTEPSYTADDTNAVWSVRAANEMGGLGEASVAAITDGINTVNTGNSNVVKTEFYNMQGIKVNESFKGTVIKVETLENGSKVSTKTNR